MTANRAKKTVPGHNVMPLMTNFSVIIGAVIHSVTTDHLARCYRLSNIHSYSSRVKSCQDFDSIFGFQTFYGFYAILRSQIIQLIR